MNTKITELEYNKYSKLFNRLLIGRVRWAPYSDDDLLDYDRLCSCVLSGNMKILNNKHYFVEPVALYGSVHERLIILKSFDECYTQSLFRQIIAILTFCHRLGIMVRDLKLRKLIFIDAEYTTIRLGTPFELYVCENWDDDLLKDRCGCPAYVCPEIIKIPITPYSGKQADMWSAGVLLYLMLVGRYPFYEFTSKKLFDKIRIGEYYLPLALDCTLDARAIIHNLINLRPESRPCALTLLRSSWMQLGAIQKIKRLAPLSASDHLLDLENDHIVPNL